MSIIHMTIGVFLALAAWSILAAFFALRWWGAYGNAAAREAGRSAAQGALSGI